MRDILKSFAKGGLRKLGYELVRQPAHQIKRNGVAPDIVIVGPYLLHNFGDDLIGAVLAKHMQERGRAVAIPNLGWKNAEWLQLIHSAKYERFGSRWPSLVIGGGGILGFAGKTPTKRYLELALTAAHKAKQANQKIVITGVGAGPLTIQEHRDICRQLCNCADAIGVRDQESRNFLVSELAIPERQITLGADIALLWPEYLKLVTIRNDLIGVQCDVDGFISEQASNIVKEGFTIFATNNARDVVMVSNGTQPTQLRSQVDLLVPELNYLCLSSFLPHLAGLRAIVTTHLHLSIAAFACRVPCFSVYVREKTKRFFDQIGRAERAIPAEEATSERIEELFDAAKRTKWSTFDEARLTKLSTDARNLLSLTDHL